MATVLDYLKAAGTSPIAPWNLPHTLATAPQGYYEPDWMYGGRTASMPVPVQDEMGKIGASVFASPATRGPQPKPAAGKPATAASAFPTSFSDPAYDSAEQYASQLTGVPQALLKSIRINGERSNADQESSAHAKTPYQIIPDTAAGIQKNYGIDPLKNPQNAALGAAYVLWEQAGKPAPSAWTPQLLAKAAGGYFGGKAGANNPFGTIADANGATVGDYTQRVMGPNSPLVAPFLNPYDPSMDKAAAGMIGAERKALMTPFSASINVGKAPELPKPEAIPTTDFSKADAALEAMRPVEMSERERITRERDGYFQGVAKALMQAPVNEGLGTFMMRLGGAALGGKLAAKDDIRREQDKFDDKMARFNAAVFSNEEQKATIAHQEATAQVQQNNEYNMNNWKVGYQRWLGSGNVDISGTNAVITRKDENGNLTVSTLPIQSAVDAAIAQQMAQHFSTMGGRQFAGNQQITSMNNAIVGRAAIAEMMKGDTGSTADGAATAAPAFYGTYIATHGLTGDLLGPEASKSLEDSVTKNLQAMQLMPGSKEWVDRHDRLMATELAKLGLAKPEIMQKMMQVGGTAPSFEQMNRYYGRSERSSTNAKGETTRSTTYDTNAADIFGD